MARTNIIQQGAEAIIIREGNSVIKDRVSKKYRHPELDKKIIKQRTRSEAKILEKASKIIPAPMPESTSFNEIKMPFIEGKKLSENLEQLDWKEICKKIGEQIAKLHDNDIIHGDLTTSNMILAEDGKLYFIDFGLGFHSKRNEDKAVDIHLIKQALEAKHFSIHKEAEKIILENYSSKDREKILEQLKKVELRGRYKH
jgi:Kae1-associated kinase Bud32